MQPAAETDARRILPPEGMVYIPPGPYVAGTSEQQMRKLLELFPGWKEKWLQSEMPTRTEHTSGFFIDKFPITNMQYLDFVKATGHRVPDHWIGQETDSDEFQFPEEFAQHPVVFITWSDAMVFAKWTKKRLCTAIEWEKAGRGPHSWIFPWGEDFTLENTNCLESKIGTTTPVDYFKAGRSYYGVYDMAGNVWEWCLDKVVNPGEHETSEDPGAELHVIRGGSWRTPVFFVRGAHQNAVAGNLRTDNFGIRCAKDAS